MEQKKKKELHAQTPEWSEANPELFTFSVSSSCSSLLNNPKERAASPPCKPRHLPARLPRHFVWPEVVIYTKKAVQGYARKREGNGGGRGIPAVSFLFSFLSGRWLPRVRH